METNDTSIWLRNSAGSLSGIVSAQAAKNERMGWIAINCQPMAVTVDLTVEQMRALAAELNAAADQIEQRDKAQAA